MHPCFVLGLIEGEGSFGIYKRKVVRKDGRETFNYQRVFQICMHIRDTELLEKVAYVLNAGMIHQQPKQNSVKFVITGTIDRNKLIRFIESNGGFHGYKKTQYEKWKDELSQSSIHEAADWSPREELKQEIKI